MNINYNYYQVFYFVAKYKNITRAADALMSSQPNVTKFINNLETQLNCKLFIRSNHGVQLTPEGEKLYAHISVAYEHINAAELELSDDQGLGSGFISVAVSEIALHSVLLPVLKTFHQTHPQIRFNLSNHSTPQAIQALKSGRVDFSVVSSPAEIPAGFCKSTLKSFRDILIGNTDYAFLQNEPHHLSDLTDCPFICLRKDTSTFDFYREFYMKHNLELKPDTEAATADQLLPIIKAGLGIGFIPETFVLDALKRKEVVEIPLIEEIPKREIYFVEDRNRYLSIAANALKKALLEGGPCIG